VERRVESVDLSVLRIHRGEPEGRDFSLGGKRWLLGGVVFLVLLTLGVTVVVYRPLGSLPEVQVTVVSRIAPRQVTATLSVNGHVIARRKAALASKVTGRLVYLGAEEGDAVRKGQVIAQIENGDLRAALDQARSNLELAEASRDQAWAEMREATLHFERIRALFEQKLVSRSEYDGAEAWYRRAVAAVGTAEANVRAMRAALQAAQVALESTYIRAPFDGIVLTKNADVGEVVSPMSAAIMTVADMESIEVEADVSEPSIHSVRAGIP